MRRARCFGLVIATLAAALTVVPDSFAAREYQTVWEAEFVIPIYTPPVALPNGRSAPIRNVVCRGRGPGVIRSGERKWWRFRCTAKAGRYPIRLDVSFPSAANVVTHITIFT